MGASDRLKVVDETCGAEEIAATGTSVVTFEQPLFRSVLHALFLTFSDFRAIRNWFFIGAALHFE